MVVVMGAVCENCSSKLECRDSRHCDRCTLLKVVNGYGGLGLACNCGRVRR